MFTDGVNEAVDGEGEEFEEERVAEVSLRDRKLPAEALHRALFDRVTEFCGGEFGDDATVLVLAALHEPGDGDTLYGTDTRNPVASKA